MKKIYKVKFNQDTIPELSGTLTVHLKASGIMSDLHSEFIKYCRKSGFTREDGDFTIAPEIVSVKLITKIENV